MSKWSGSSYTGPVANGWEEGIGSHKFPNGVVYEGNFKKGEFDGEGTLIYPNGVSDLPVISKGRYVAKWDRGKLIEGKYFFFDDLEYIAKDKQPECKAAKVAKWDYCTDKNRQFYTEISKGTLRPDGLTLLSNDIKGLRSIPEGTYDIGDGYYDPVKRVICEYDSNFKRDLNEGEEQWIVEKCRYNA